ncbi:Fe-S cluster assembly ATPase SufC [Candidatus Dependentiae bacterium]|nr:Fe-S cluster assembly ATPase SufC [Candidatus Dependentiae bacterium]
MEKTLLEVKNLSVCVEGKQILNNLNLNIKSGQIHAIMGPNGSGKSTFSYSLIGHPKYQISSGQFMFYGQDITRLPVDKKAKNGIFLAFQYPYEIEGLSLRNFLRQSYNSLYSGTEKELSFEEFNAYLVEKTQDLKINSDFLQRGVNFGFSGGEKKKAEILQLAVLEPKLAVLDEIDSGLDVDSLRVVCESIKKVKLNNPSMSLLIITHYPRILHFLEPDFVHILKKGSIVESGNKALATTIENEGYK